MDRQSSIEPQLCGEHQRLFEECEKALKIWDEHRAEFCEFRFVSREAGDELLSLQARYARAYTVLQTHKRNCAVCQSMARENVLIS